MASFDFIECSIKAFRYVGQNFQALLPLSLIAIAIKILCTMAIFSFSMEQNFLRQGLVYIPGYLLEGWVIATLTVRAMMSEESKDYAFIPNENYNLKNAVLSAALLYVLIKITLAVLIGLPFAMSPEAMQASTPLDTQDQSSGAAFFMVVVAGAMLIWAFKLLWVYIPPALGLSIEVFLKKAKGFKSSFYMLGLWLMCSVPINIALLLVRGVIASPFEFIEGEPTPLAFKLVFSLFSVSFDYALSLIVSIGMAYGIISIFRDGTKKVSIW
ncbi:MAG: hypothetical protein KTR28_00095 [Micavibrio sp.]|nr:hypothetical protein [Micavibrio sp.]